MRCSAPVIATSEAEGCGLWGSVAKEGQLLLPDHTCRPVDVLRPLARSSDLPHPTFLHMLLASILLCGVGATPPPPTAAGHHSAPPPPSAAGHDHSGHHDHLVSPGGKPAAGSTGQEAPSHYTAYPLLVAVAVAALAVVSTTHPAASSRRRLPSPLLARYTRCGSARRLSIGRTSCLVSCAWRRVPSWSVRASLFGCIRSKVASRRASSSRSS